MILLTSFCVATFAVESQAYQFMLNRRDAEDTEEEFKENFELDFKQNIAANNAIVGCALA
ncbi:MAG: hypothetical protein KI793_05275 [Rivularia sp. (in: Bacteria)]|nr:hypothetical protein [Rivularia sp. MS3]